jgi:hypothetical protein
MKTALALLVVLCLAGCASYPYMAQDVTDALALSMYYGYASPQAQANQFQQQQLELQRQALANQPLQHLQPAPIYRGGSDTFYYRTQNGESGYIWVN